MNWHTTRTFRAAVAGVLGLLAAATLPACGSEVTYSYFNVKVDIDPASVDDDLRRTIASCGIFVTGDDADQVSVPCTLTKVPYALGIVDFATSRKRGTLTFTAIMMDLNRGEIAKGTSGPVAIVPNSTTQTSVLAVKVAGGMPAPGDASASDAAAGSPDAASDSL